VEVSQAVLEGETEFEIEVEPEEYLYDMLKNINLPTQVLSRYVYDVVEDSLLQWQAVFKVKGETVSILGELDRYFDLFHWKGELEVSKKEVMCDSGGDLEMSELVYVRSHRLLVDSVFERLQENAPLFQPEPGMNTTLSQDRWVNMRAALTSAMLLIAIAVFEAVGDFQGAMSDLALRVAQSPWALKLMRPQQVRSFMHHLAFITVPDTLHHRSDT